MCPPRRDSEYLEDVYEAMTRIVAYTTAMDYGQFLQDSRTQDAVIRNLQVIGEAVKRLSRQLKEQYASLPWREMAGMRDRIVHDYFGINYDIVWAVVTQDIPLLLPQVQALRNRV